MDVCPTTTASASAGAPDRLLDDADQGVPERRLADSGRVPLIAYRGARSQPDSGRRMTAVLAGYRYWASL